MVVRMGNFKTQEEKFAAYKESIELAKQAITCDLNDGYSWYVYGNAHLTYFFHATQEYEHLNSALKAYQ